jgi:hypothetical protein
MLEQEADGLNRQPENGKCRKANALCEDGRAERKDAGFGPTMTIV